MEFQWSQSTFSPIYYIRWKRDRMLMLCSSGISVRPQLNSSRNSRLLSLCELKIFISVFCITSGNDESHLSIGSCSPIAWRRQAGFICSCAAVLFRPLCSCSPNSVPRIVYSILSMRNATPAYIFNERAAFSSFLGSSEKMWMFEAHSSCPRRLRRGSQMAMQYREEAKQCICEILFLVAGINQAMCRQTDNESWAIQCYANW